MQKIGMSLFVGAVLLGAVACDDGAIDTAGNAWNCNTICDVVAECSDEDQAECREECTDKSDNESFEDDAEACADCVKPNDSCAESVVECSDECAGVVVLSTN